MHSPVSTVVVAPHLSTDLQGLFKSFETFCDGWVGHAKPGVLSLVPGGTNPQHCSTARQYVERRDSFGEERRVSIGDPGNQQAEAQPTCLAGDEGQRTVTL